VFAERHQQPQQIKWNFRETNCYKALETIMGECFPTMQFFYDGTNELPYNVYVDSNFRRLVYNK